MFPGLILQQASRPCYQLNLQGSLYEVVDSFLHILWIKKKHILRNDGTTNKFVIDCDAHDAPGNGKKGRVRTGSAGFGGSRREKIGRDRSKRT